MQSPALQARMCSWKQFSSHVAQRPEVCSALVLAIVNEAQTA